MLRVAGADRRVESGRRAEAARDARSSAPRGLPLSEAPTEEETAESEKTAMQQDASVWHFCHAGGKGGLFVRVCVCVCLRSGLCGPMAHRRTAV